MPMRFRRRLLLLSGLILIGLGGAVAPGAEAEEATLMDASLSLSEAGGNTGLYASTSYEFDLPDTLKNALRRGIALYFVQEVRIEKNRWYWFDKKILDARYVLRLSFNPITRRYRLSYKGLSTEFDALEQVLPFIKSIRHWRIADYNPLENAEDYTVQTRFYLDTTRLPKPMQVTSAGREDWTVSSDWYPITIPREIADR